MQSFSFVLGNGWFLEKIVVKDPVTNTDYQFVCHRFVEFVLFK